MLATMLAALAYAADGDVFTYKGINYKILSESARTVEVTENEEAKGAIVIPASVVHKRVSYSVKALGNGAFSRSDVTSVKIPATVTAIGDDAFRDCARLTTIRIAGGVKEIGYGAFWGCESLTTVTLPKTLTTLGERVFDNCSSLRSINVAVGNKHFCSVNGVLFDIRKTKLIRCPEAKIKCVIPGSVREIGSSAFESCIKLTSITIPNTVTKIGATAFGECLALTSIKLPESITEIEDGTFSGCSSLTSFVVPNSVTSIGWGAFDQCHKLKVVTIGKSVTEIGIEAFSFADLQKIISLNPTPPAIEDYSSFDGVSTDIPVYIPKGSLNAYKSADGWNQFSNYKEL